MIPASHAPWLSAVGATSAVGVYCFVVAFVFFFLVTWRMSRGPEALSREASLTECPREPARSCSAGMALIRSCGEVETTRDAVLCHASWPDEPRAWASTELRCRFVWFSWKEDNGPGHGSLTKHALTGPGRGTAYLEVLGLCICDCAGWVGSEERLSSHRATSMRIDRAPLSSGLVNFSSHE